MLLQAQGLEVVNGITSLELGWDCSAIKYWGCNGNWWVHTTSIEILLIFQKFTEILVSGMDTLWTMTVLSQYALPQLYAFSATAFNEIEWYRVAKDLSHSTFALNLLIVGGF